jgi:hypothetical protein
VRLKPHRKGLCAFAGVAPDAAKDDVLFRDDASIIDDVLPRRTVATRGRNLSEQGATVDARTIALNNVAL